MKEFWTDERVATLRKVWGTESTRTTAARLGCTKNSVIGKAYRLGLPSHPNPTCRPWSATEDDVLLSGRGDGVTYAGISGDMDRTAAAVGRRAWGLGLARHRTPSP